MKKSSRSKGPGIIGKGKVTPTQIAFIVDRYLCDNRFSETRNLFRTEASSLISKSPLRDALKSLMTLDDMLNDYVCLKAQKVAVDQERARLDQEKIRVQNLLQGMQNVMNTYNASLNVPPPLPAAPIPQQENYTVPSSGRAQYNTPNAMSVSLLGNKRVEFGSFSTPLTSQSITGKRKGPEGSLGAPPVASRKTRTTTAQENSAANDKFPQANKAANKFSSQTPSETLTVARNSATNELVTGHGSSVAKCLFNKADSSLPTSSTCPRTPQKRVSPGSHKSSSPQKAATPTNCTIVTKERFIISPLKKITSYTVERSRSISSLSPIKSNMKMSTKRDHVKGRLNFDDTDAAGMSLEASATADFVSASPSGSEQETDLLDIDLSNLDFLSEDFSFSELLCDFDLVCQGSTNPNAPIETLSGSSPESGNGNLESDQGYPEYASKVRETIQGKDMSPQEPRVAGGE